MQKLRRTLLVPGPCQGLSEQVLDRLLRRVKLTNFIAVPLALMVADQDTYSHQNNDNFHDQIIYPKLFHIYYLCDNNIQSNADKRQG